MTEQEIELALQQVIELIRKLSTTRIEKPQDIVNEEFANCEDLKSRLIEMIVDYTLRAVLRVKPARKRENSEQEQQSTVPSKYVI